MSRTVRILVLAVLLAPLLWSCQAQHDADLIFRGGTLIDGSGAAPRMADVAVLDGKVLAIGDLAEMSGAREIDTDGLVVAPGFVDIHSHADLIVLGDRRTQEQLLSAKIRQGVTTIIVGNCGLGVAPASQHSAGILAGINGWMTPTGIEAGPLTVAEYLERLETGGVVLNVGTLLPHGPVRISVIGLRGGLPADSEVAVMRELVAEGLDQGAFGLSTGLVYPPGMYSPTDELLELAHEVAARDRIYASHVRGSSEMLIPATEELIEIARQTGARVHHSHLEAVGERFWPDVARVLELEDRARDEGLRVSHDVFLYTRAATMMSAIFPPWAIEGGLKSLLARLKESFIRKRLRQDLRTKVPSWPPWFRNSWPHNLVKAVGWDGILLASVGPEGPSEWVGRSVAFIAEQEGRAPIDVVADLMISQNGQVGQLVDEISGREGQIDVLLSIVSHPAAAVISDAEDYGRGVAHPAHAGAFARALRTNRERKLLPLQQLVRRMTSYPAQLIGLQNRGSVREGAPADLVVFDPKTVTDQATWSDPRTPASGIHWVTINGRLVVEKERYKGGLAGQVLRP